MRATRLICPSCQQIVEQEHKSECAAQDQHREEVRRHYRAMTYAQYRATSHGSDQERAFLDERTRFYEREGCDLCPVKGRRLTVFHRRLDAIPSENGPDLTALCPDYSVLIPPTVDVPIQS